MLIEKFSLRFSLVFSIVAMGLLGLLVAVFIGEQYRIFSVESQRSAFQEMVRLQVDEVREELEHNSVDLGRAVQSTGEFRKMFREKNIDGLRKHLQSQFHQYFVTTGIVRLNRLTLYDLDGNYLVHAMRDERGQVDYGDALCGDIIARMIQRRGTERLKSISGICLVKGQPNHSVIVPVGGLRPLGYVEVMTDPAYNFKEIEHKLGLPVKMELPNGQDVYHSVNWPELDVSEHGILAEHMVKSRQGVWVLRIKILHDNKEFRQNFEKTRNTVLIIALLVTVVLAVLMLTVMKKSALDPLKRLGTRLNKIGTDDTALGDTLEVSGNKEIRDLSHYFNEMTEDLKNVYDELKTANQDLKSQVDERKKVEQELKVHRGKLEELVDKRTADLVLARDEALQANRAKSKFLANMSHELRTPLNAIIGYSELLMEDTSDSGLTMLSSDLTKIRNSAKHLLALIDGILDLSKIEAGKMDLYPEEFRINDVISDMVATMQPMILENNNNMDVLCPENIVLNNDLTKLRQCLYNLLSNAAKFTRNGKISLEVGTKMLGGGKFVEIDVVDNGIGIDKEKMPDLFQAFSQADLSTTREYGGTGLGLVITRHFCNMMGGDINVESEKSKGSRFKMILPVDITMKTSIGLLSIANEGKDLPPVDPAAIRFTTSNPQEQKFLERREYISKVLVIDDDVVAVDLMARFLAREGYRTEVATSGREGLIKAKEFKPDVITLDIMMPEMDGWSVLEEIKKDPETKDIPVIVLTMIDDRTRGFAMGAKDYLTKPFNRDELSDILKNVLQEGAEGNTVLVVDDDKNVRSAAKYVLEKSDWTIHEAENGLEAMEFLCHQQPELIMMDLVMPKMDGFELLSSLGENPLWKNIPVVVMTAKDMSEQEIFQLHESIKHVFRKSAVGFDELFGEVNELLRGMVRGKAGKQKTGSDSSN